MTNRELKNLSLITLLLAIVLYGWILLTGQTFGQRCAKVYAKKSSDWCECVERLSKGGNVELNKKQ